MDKILSIDPGGKTGIYYKNGEQETFLEINKEWKETYGEIKELVKEKQIQQVIYEDTNYIHRKTKDGLNLFRLLGALECLEVKKIEKVNVLAVKKLTKQLLAGVKKLEEISYEVGRGKGWMFKGKRVSIHCLEAYIVYWLFFQSQSQM